MTEFDFARAGPADYLAAATWARQARSRAMRGAGRAFAAFLGRATAQVWARRPRLAARAPGPGARPLRRA